jgi:hypothetical protein
MRHRPELAVDRRKQVCDLVFPSDVGVQGGSAPAGARDLLRHFLRRHRRPVVVDGDREAVLRHPQTDGGPNAPAARGHHHDPFHRHALALSLQAAFCGRRAGKSLINARSSQRAALSSSASAELEQFARQLGRNVELTAAFVPPGRLVRVEL